MSHSLSYSFLLPILLLLFYRRKIKMDGSVVLLVIYLTVFFIFNQFFTDVKTVLGKKGYYFLYTLLEYFSLGTLIWLSIPEKKFRVLFFTLSALFSIFLIIFFTAGNIKRLDSIPIGIESIVLMIFVIFYFYSQLKNVSNQSLYENFSFWIVLGILSYIGLTFFFNILANSLDTVHFSKYYFYSYLGDILKNIFFSLGVIFLAKKIANGKKNNPSSIPYLDII